MHKTNIIYKSNLNDNSAEEYLELCERNGLLESKEQEDNNIDKLYERIENGSKYLNALQEFVDITDL